jgi:hypothetical protein
MSGCQVTSETSQSEKANAEDSWTVNDILREFGPAYLAKHQSKMSSDQIKVLHALMACRTEKLGCAVFRCQQCQKAHFFPKSCGNRHCPSCQGSKAKAWLIEQQARLLPCNYFMLTFTVPAEMRKFIRSHPKECLRALFDAVRDSLCNLASDSRWIGSPHLGFVSVLHTWGRDLNYHPHIHCIVPGGALSPSGNEWLPSRADFLVPVRALSKIFRAKYRAILKRHGLYGSIPTIVWRQNWVVHCKDVGDGRQSLRYLAPYVFRVAIGNHRIARLTKHADGTGEVVFMVRRSGTRRYRPCPVTAEEFIRRFLQHVLPTGLQKVRHYGFMHARSKVSLAWLKMLVTLTLNLVYVIEVGLDRSEPRLKQNPKCTECGGELLFIGFEVARPQVSGMFDSS